MIQIYEKYYGTMLATAKSVIADHSLAEDAVSNAIIKIMKNLHKIADTSSHKTKAYVVIIVRNSAIDLLRKRNSCQEEDIDGLELSDSGISMLETLTMKESYNIMVIL